MKYLFLKYIGSFLFIFCLFSIPVSAQDNRDSLNFVRMVEDLQNSKQYASAHFLLQDRLRTEGLQSNVVYLLVNNCLNHYFKEKDFALFYLRDKFSSRISVVDTTKRIKIARVQRPDRLLKIILQNDAKNPLIYKTYGDFYNLQLTEFAKFTNVNNPRYMQLQEKVFANYEKAVSLGLNDHQLNRWLGMYYRSKNNSKAAEDFFKRNLKVTPPDARSLLNLAEIYYEEKQYTQSCTYAMRSARYFPAEQIDLKYNALRLAAKTLLKLGDLQKYHLYIHECMSLLPDEPAAYLDLIDFYYQRDEFSDVELIFKKLLGKNPFQQSSFMTLEKYIRNTRRYYFADSLLDNLLQKFENMDEAMANIYWAKGNIAYLQNFKVEANKYWEFSRNFMKKYLPADDFRISQVGKMD